LNDHGSVYIVPLSFGYRQSPRPIRSLSDEACEKS
jgi:nitroimidazol reductase NimA-like FMN-containing flavoprotein (pyridoxamine 5'-phosphate oxidase superfamily)